MFKALVRAGFGAFLALGLVACQVALRADGQAPQCDSTLEGQLCTDPTDPNVLTCQGGQCLPCTPDLSKCLTCGLPDLEAQLDRDGDGYKVCGEAGQIDCNDDPATGKNIHPGAAELCNGIDDNCNNQVDEEPNVCSQKGQKCLSALKVCVAKDDCRLPGATCPTGFSCDLNAGGPCQTGDCTVDPSRCTGTQHCDATTHSCVSSAEPGQPCSPTTRCDSSKPAHCIALAEAGISTPSGSICTLECCSSADCASSLGPGFVCRQGSSIGGVCVLASSVGLTSGPQGAYTSCSTGQVCQSGVCGPDGHCADSCCGDISCGSGGTCAYSTTSMQVACTASGGSGGFGDTKTRSGGCQSHLWITQDLGFGITQDVCTKQCCSSSDCGSDTTFTCRTEQIGSGGPSVNVCYQDPFGSPAGSKPGGSSCGGDGDCRSGHCSSGRCDDFCCKDSDCASGTICLPQNLGGVYAGKCVVPS